MVSAPKASLDPVRVSGYDFCQARDLYLSLKQDDRSDSFTLNLNRAVTYFVEAVGNKDVSSYTTVDGATFRDYLLEKGLSGASIKRTFSCIRPLFNFVISEYGLDGRNPLQGTYIPEGKLPEKRQPIPLEAIRSIQDQCVDINDDIRWLVAIISNTGMRLAEACGLQKFDVVLESDTPISGLGLIRLED